MNTENVHIRFATTDEDRSAIYRLRYELYVEDQGLFQNEADHERRWLRDELDAHSHLLMAEADGRVVGTMRLTMGMVAPFPEDIHKTYDLVRFRGIVEEDDMAVLSRLLLRHQYRGSDLTIRCVIAMFTHAVEQDLDILFGNCETHLINNYFKFGFRPYGELYNHPTNGVLVRIASVIGDLEYLRNVKSPLLEIAARQPTPAPPAKIKRIRAALTTDVAARSKFDVNTLEYVGEISELLRDGERLAGIMDALPLDEARVLLNMSHILSCSKGDAIIRKGHVSRTLYMLLSGSLDVYDDDGVIAHIEQRGTIVGEVAFFSAGGRMNDVLAGEDGTRILALSDRVLRDLISSHGPVAAKFLHFVACGLCEKLRAQASITKRASDPPHR